MKAMILVALMLVGLVQSQAVAQTCLLKSGFYNMPTTRRLQAMAEYCPVRPTGFKKCNVTNANMSQLHNNWRKDVVNIPKFTSSITEMLKLLTEMQQGKHLKTNWQNDTTCKGKSTAGYIGNGRRLQAVLPKCLNAAQLKVAVDYQATKNVINNSAANANQCAAAIKDFKAGFLCSGSNWMSTAMANNTTKVAKVCAAGSNTLWGTSCQSWIHDVVSLNYLMNGWDQIMNGRRRMQMVKRATKSFVPWYRSAKDCGKDVMSTKRRMQMVVVPEVVRYKSCRDMAESLTNITMAGNVTTGKTWANYFRFLANKVGDDYAKAKVEEAFKGVDTNRPGVTRRLQAIAFWKLQIETDLKAPCINSALFKPKNTDNLV